jgi:hypothetical protein
LLDCLPLASHGCGAGRTGSLLFWAIANCRGAVAVGSSAFSGEIAEKNLPKARVKNTGDLLRTLLFRSVGSRLALDVAQPDGTVELPLPIPRLAGNLLRADGSCQQRLDLTGLPPWPSWRGPYTSPQPSP